MHYNKDDTTLTRAAGEPTEPGGHGHARLYASELHRGECFAQTPQGTDEAHGPKGRGRSKLPPHDVEAGPVVYRIAWATLTKCVDGEPCITICKNCGMLSKGVLPPESKFMMLNRGKARSANWGMERARVARKMLSEAMANR